MYYTTVQYSDRATVPLPISDASAWLCGTVPCHPSTKGSALEWIVGPCHSLTKSSAVSGFVGPCHPFTKGSALEGYVGPCHSLTKAVLFLALWDRAIP